MSHRYVLIKIRFQPGKSTEATTLKLTFKNYKEKKKEKRKIKMINIYEFSIIQLLLVNNK